MARQARQRPIRQRLLVETTIERPLAIAVGQLPCDIDESSDVLAQFGIGVGGLIAKMDFSPAKPRASGLVPGRGEIGTS